MIKCFGSIDTCPSATIRVCEYKTHCYKKAHWICPQCKLSNVGDSCPQCGYGRWDEVVED